MYGLKLTKDDTAHSHGKLIKSRVVRSTIAAEAFSLQEGLESGFYHWRLLEDILPHNTVPIIAYIDNKSVVDAIYSTKLVDDKRLRLDIAAIRESLENNEVSKIKLCSGKYN